MRARAALSAALAAAVVFGAGGWWVRDVVRNQWLTAARETATRDAFSVTSVLESGARPRGTDFSFVVVRTDGRRSMAAGPVFEGDLDRPLPGFPPRVGWGIHTVRGKGRFVVGTTNVLPPDWIKMLTGSGGQPAQRLTVYVLVSPADANTAVATIDRLLGWGLPVAVPFVGLIAWFVTGRALRPVEAIRAKMADISAHALDQRVPVPATDDEITSLARTTNETLDRLEHAHHRQQRFVADASHELRTPLAGLRNSLEIALAYPERTDWPITVATALADVDRLQRLAEDLLLLASPAQVKLTTSDLAGIVEEQVAERAHTGDGPAFTAHTTRPALVRESEIRLARIVRNLLDNAARHARTKVAATVAVTDSSVTLTVTDDGPGVPPEDRERIFERFVRLDDARTRAHGGAGLGLTIVRDLVTGLGGTVRVTGCSTFVVTLPGDEA
ncbi:HAMP domain-containing histidine kinase [Actinoallomurus purpureus]|uniref:sensor histidine kinase n=1 Tax=Actinoallomurus purpureus TaxID=478114 RepID=UPI0020923E57|nr:HAMP domain-containing sensor histidine kinase [Actinoallomurus purpureus]MCO6010403.1 HAMP domain-containing histidine kinase [Actinoallomurus purpureus]